MKVSLQDLKIVYPEQIWLEFSQTNQKRLKLNDRCYSNETARKNAELNHLCLNAFVEWLEENFELENAPIGLPNNIDLASIWEVVNGTALALGKTRLALIPSDALDTEEFSVPQEWVDIPSWASNYYLAVQVDLEHRWMRIWGYTTHQILKEKGRYDPIYRTYSLEREYVIADIDVMWVAREICPDEKAVINPLPPLAEFTAETLIGRLSQRSPYSPRLEVEFARWAALLQNETWRQQLYQRRVTPVVATPVKPLVNLSRWFENVFESGWQTVENLFSTAEARFAFEPVRGDDLLRDDPTVIKVLIDQIYTSPQEHKRKQAAERLGEVGTGNAEEIAALIHLIRTTNDEETRWAAAESLWMIDPGNPAAGVKRGIDLGMQLAGNAVALLVAILPKSDRKTAVLLRVYPMKSQTLPLHLELIVLDESGDTFLEAQARTADNCIQLKFSGEPGERFSVKVALGEASITEDFAI